MSDSEMRPMPEDELDVRLVRYLEWESGQLRGVPQAKEVAMRIATEPTQRRWAGSPALVWAVVVLALVLVSVAILVVGSSDLNLGITTASPSPHSSPAGPTPTAGPTSTPVTGAGPCRDGRIDIQPAAPGAALPADAATIQVPQGGRLAMAIEEGPDSGSIVIVGPDGVGARVVATFSGQDIQDTSGVQVVQWSPSGEALLVSAGNSHFSDPDQNCSNLFLVEADGSAVTRLTNLGPDEGAGGATFSPSGSRIAYTVGNDLYVATLDGAARVMGPTCSFIVGELRWAPDETQILVQCDASLYIFDLSADGSRRQVPLGPLDSRWASGGDSIVVALGDTVPGLEGGPLSIVDVDPADLTHRTRVLSDASTEWVLGVPMLSPDGRWLLVWGQGDVNPPPEFYPTYLVDTATGATTQMPWPVLAETSSVLADPMRRRPGAIWLPGNDRVLIADEGTLYEVDLLGITRTAVGSVPAPDFAWFPLPR